VKVAALGTGLPVEPSRSEPNQPDQHKRRYQELSTIVSMSFPGVRPCIPSSREADTALSMLSSLGACQRKLERVPESESLLCAFAMCKRIACAVLSMVSAGYLSPPSASEGVS
jgi:hypothetical protein